VEECGCGGGGKEKKNGMKIPFKGGEERNVRLIQQAKPVALIKGCMKAFFPRSHPFTSSRGKQTGQNC
jgi:hypothetical protein